MVSAAEKKLAGFKLVKAEIDAEIAKVHEGLDAARSKINENIWSKENRDGFLTGKQEDYLKCLEIKHRDLELLFRQDEAKWTE